MLRTILYEDETKKALLKQLEEIQDFREYEGKIIYPLSEIIFITLFGILKGYTTFKDLHQWMEFNKNNSALKKYSNKKLSMFHLDQHSIEYLSIYPIMD